MTSFKERYLGLAAVLLNLGMFGAFLGRAEIVSGPITNPNNGHRYVLLAPSSWTAAQAEAVALGGNLATVRSALEQEWIWQTFGTNSGVARTLWIGLADVDRDGVFAWASGESVPFVNWYKGEPNRFGNNEFYTSLLSWSPYWNDLPDLPGPDYGADAVPFGVVEVVPETEAVFRPTLNNGVDQLAIQADGRILVAGGFTEVNGMARRYLARLLPDGLPDESFKPERIAGQADSQPMTPVQRAPVVRQGVVGGISALGIQRDDRLLIGEWFGDPGSGAIMNPGRLDPGGQLDWGFTPEVGGAFTLLEEPTGDIVLGGVFESMGDDVSQKYLGRLSPGGAVDRRFTPVLDGVVHCLALQPDGRIIVGGRFTQVGGKSHNHLVRLEADGSVDDGFGIAANGTSVDCLIVQPDGKILVAGWFNQLGTESRYFLGRIHVDGTLDDSFKPGATRGVTAMALQADGKILIGGAFTGISRVSRKYLARVLPNGAVDLDFDLAGNAPVSAIALEADGGILVAGDFTELGDTPRSYFARLTNPTPATQELRADQNTLIWSRGGSSPEVSRTWFYHSVDGSNWQLLGPGVRVNETWQFTGMPLPVDGQFRARGQLCGDGRTGGGWVESPLIRASSLRISNVRMEPESRAMLFDILGPKSGEYFVEAVHQWDGENWGVIHSGVLGAEPMTIRVDTSKTSLGFVRVRLQ